MGFLHGVVAECLLMKRWHGWDVLQNDKGGEGSTPPASNNVLYAGTTKSLAQIYLPRWCEPEMNHILDTRDSPQQQQQALRGDSMDSML
jgi:hypothetical protein